MMMTDKERFIQIFKEKITRDGSAELLNYLFIDCLVISSEICKSVRCICNALN